MRSGLDYSLLFPVLEQIASKLSVRLVDFISCAHGDLVEKWWRREWASESFNIFIIRERGAVYKLYATKKEYGKWLEKEGIS